MTTTPPLPAAMPPLPAKPAAATATADIGDWMPPMLVKEIRQGLRSRVFVVAFLMVQFAMIYSVLISMLDASQAIEDGGNADSSSTGVFWTIILVPLCFLMPFRGFASLGKEIRQNTIELVYLTKLSSRSIVAGKWLSIMAQSVLLVTAVLPYAMLRYFIGGVNILNDLLTIGLLLTASALFTVLAVALSPFQSVIFRVFLIFCGIFLLLSGVPWLIFGAGALSVDLFDGWFYASILLLTPLFIFLFIEMGAGNIAPPAENHAIGKRLACVLIFLIAPIALFSGIDLCRMVYYLSLLALGPVLIDAMAEETRLVPSISAAFARRGVIGMVAARFLTPGWFSAVNFVVLMGVLTATLVPTFHWLAGRDGNMNNDELTQWVASCVSIVGAILFPFALVRLFSDRLRLGHAVWALVTLGQFILMGMISSLCAVAHIDWKDFKYLFAPLPACSLTVMLDNRGSEDAIFFLIVTGGVTLLSILILQIRALPLWRKIREMEDHATETNLAAHFPEQ